MKDNSKNLLFLETIFKNKSAPSFGMKVGKNNIYAKLTPNTISTTIESKI